MYRDFAFHGKLPQVGANATISITYFQDHATFSEQAGNNQKFDKPRGFLS